MDLNEDLLTQYRSEMNTLLGNISMTLSGENSIKITPLAIFRKFEAVKPIEEKKVWLGSASRRNQS